jgi:predicted ester cyclase
MGAAEHDSRVRDFFRRVWNERDYAAAGRLYAETFSNPAAPGVSGAAAKTMFIRSYHQAFPDLTVTIEDLVTADRVVAVRYVAAGTDLGGFRGRPPTGRRVTIWAVSFLRFDGDRVVSEWVGADYLGLFEQLGTVTSPWAENSGPRPDDDHPATNPMASHRGLITEKEQADDYPP